MLPGKRVRRSLFVLVLLIGMLFLPCLDSRRQRAQSVGARNIRQVAFTPHVTSLNIQGTWETPNISPLETQTPGDAQLQDTSPPDEGPTRKYLIIDGHVFHVGDMFYAAEGLRLSAEHRSAYGKFGYATLMDHPEYRLLWHHDAHNHTSYIIVHMNDILYSGENGSLEQFDDLEDGIDHMHSAMGAGVGGFGAMLAVGASGCLPTAGTTCVIGAVGGFLSLLGGAAGEAWFYFDEVRPARDAIISTMEAIEINR